VADGQLRGSLNGPALIVDPDRYAVQHVQTGLARLGYGPIHWARSPDEGIQHAHQLALVVCEAQFTNGTCLEFVRRLRAFSCPPFIVIASANAQPGLIARALKGGADGCIDKPVDLEQLHDVLLEARGRVELWEAVVMRMVGRVGLQDAQRSLRTTMLREALRRTGSSRRAAAQLLGIDRRCVQRMISEEAPDLD
jgi:CheY-like chemotaxis protein